MLAQQYLTGEQTVRIIGTEDAPVWLTFDKDYIAGEFDFTVEAGSTAPRNEAFRRDMALQMVSAMQPFAQAGLVNMPKLAEYVLGTGFGVKNPEAFLTEPPPQAMEGEGGMPMGPGGPPMPPEMMAQGGQPPPVPPEVLAQAGLGGPAPMEQGPEQVMLSEEELIKVIEGLQSGQLTPEDLPPEILAQVEEFLSQQGGPQGAPEMEAPQGGVPDELALIIEGLQSGDLNPEDVPPEILAQIEAMMQGQQQ
jgi:hypothetical protein